MKVLVIGGAGYIGSMVTKHLESRGVETEVVDRCDFGYPSHLSIACYGSRGINKHDYDALSPSYLAEFEVIILLAGYSSVQMSSDIFQTFDANVTRFTKLLNKIGPETKLIYASSGSVYGNMIIGDEAREIDTFGWAINPYDLSKQIIDMYASMTKKNYYGLRFGTVCGNSLNPRMELMVNAMVLSAKKNGRITISNPDNMRAILAMEDLVEAIYKVVIGTRAPGLYNLCSFNYSIEDIGCEVSECMNVDFDIAKGNSTYSFSLDNYKFNQTFDWEPKETVETIVQDVLRLDFNEIIVNEHKYKR